MNIGSKNSNWRGGKLTTQCPTCKTKFAYFPSAKRKFCSLSCSNKGENNPMFGKTPWQKGRKDHQLAEKNPAWKGDKVGLTALHTWVVSRKGKPKVCVDCGVTSKVKALHWSNKDHSYTRNLDDYEARCPLCHKRYDIKFNGQTNKRKATP